MIVLPESAPVVSHASWVDGVLGLAIALVPLVQAGLSRRSNRTLGTSITTKLEKFDANNERRSVELRMTLDRRIDGVQAEMKRDVEGVRSELNVTETEIVTRLDVAERQIGGLEDRERQRDRDRMLHGGLNRHTGT